MSSSLRKRTKEKLRASEARYRTFVDHATDAFMLHAEDGTVLDVNPQTCDNLGYTRDELLSHDVADFTGILAAGTVAVLGFFIIPRKHQPAAQSRRDCDL